MTARAPRRAARLLALLACAVAPAGARADAAPPVESARDHPEELEAFQRTLDRFQARLIELQRDIKDIVDEREALERAELDRGYRALRGQLERDNDALRQTAIHRFEAFLEKYPRSAYTPHVMFRLAELYYELSEEEWAIADEEYRRRLEGLGEDALLDAPEEPRKDFSRSIRLYERVIRDYPDYEYVDGCTYMLGYIYSEPNAVQFDEEKGLHYFEQLVERFPDSQFAANAHMRIGEYLFDYAQGVEDLREALPHYEAVVRLEGEGGRLYDEGLYKLAWTYYKLSEYDKALELLTKLLDWSTTTYVEQTGQPSPMEPEAIEYTAISFSDISDRTGQHPLEVAQAFYERVGGRDFENKVYKRLADVLSQQARLTEAIDVYRYIQDRWPNDPDGPDMQWTVARLYLSLAVPDPEAAQRAIAELNDRYNDESEWWRANRNNPDALAKARKYIEESLATVAIQYHRSAIETGDPAMFGKAADLYARYLQKFPFADDYYRIQWWLADTLNKAGRLDEALEQYEQLWHRGHHNYHEASLWMVMQLRRQALAQRYGKAEALPPDAVVEATEKLPSGKERPIYRIDDDHREFIEICDQLVATDFAPTIERIEAQLAQAKDEEARENLEADLEQVKAYAAGLEQFRPALAYLPAQILYAYGHLDEARERFVAIIDRWPQRDEAAYAAALMVDSYLDQEDLVNVRKYAQLYAGMALGRSYAATSKRVEFQNQAEAATFKLAMEYIEKGDREAAARAFLRFIEEFPNSKYRKDALYNAANSYDIIGRADEAIRLFEQYVRENPDDERSRPLYFRLAGIYASALELEKAIEYYEALYERTKGRGEDYPDAPAALYNAAFLRIGIGDHEGAAREFERYAVENPEQPDAERVFFMAGDEWERVGPQQALRFWRRYLARYPAQDPDHVMEAYHRIAVLTEQVGSPREVDRAWEELLAAYEGFEQGGGVGPRGRHYAAAAAFRPIWKQWEEFREIRFTKDEKRNAELLLNVKVRQLKDIEESAAALVQRFQDFEYSSAALYVVGLAYLRYADMLYEAPPPPGLDEEELMLYQEALDERRIPVEDKGKARLAAVVDMGREQHDWSEWQTKASEELARRFPLEFAPEKQEFRALADSQFVPRAGPLSPETRDADGEEER